MRLRGRVISFGRVSIVLGLAIASGCSTADAPPDELVTDPITGLVPIAVKLGEPAPAAEVGHLFTLGSLDGQEWEAFGSVGDAALLASGRLAVADQQTRRLHVYDSTGTYLSSVGGPGDGPGELVRLGDIVADGNDVLVADPGRGFGITRFELDAGTVVTDRLSPACPSTKFGARRCRDTHLFSDGRSLRVGTQTGSVTENSLELELDVGRVAWFAIAGPDTVVALVEHADVDQLRTQYPDDEGFWSVEFFDRMYGGRPVSAVNGRRIAIARSDTARIRVWTVDGEPEAVFQVLGHARPVESSDIRVLRDLAWPDHLDEAVSAWLSTEPAQVQPLIGDLLLDRRGRLWIGPPLPREVQIRRDSLEWRVVGADGSIAYRVVLPNEEILDLGYGRVVTKTSSDLGIDEVRVYEVSVGG